MTTRQGATAPAWDFAGIVGQEEPKRRLRRLLAAGRLPHAVLFYGAEGVGKRRVATAVAAASLCEAPQDGAACGACANCRAFRAGAHPDFYTIAPDGSESSRAKRIIRIDAVRELLLSLAREPVLAKRRVVLIDEAEKMNDAAANSLLKTLEEPTGDVRFLLVTGARAALLDTIVSRCLLLRFTPLAAGDVEEILRRQDIPQAEAATLAALADGSAERAFSLRESGALSLRADAVSLLTALPSMDLAALWEAGERLAVMSREDFALWLRYVRLTLRDVLVLYSGGAILYSTDIADRLTPLCTRYTEAQICAMLRVAQEAETRHAAYANAKLLADWLLLQLTSQ